MIIDKHSFVRKISARSEFGRPSLFLDRDGVLIVDTGYVSSPSSVSLIDGAAAMVKVFNDAGIPVIVVTNQSGIGRGLFGVDEFVAVNARMQELIWADTGGGVDAIFACTAPPSDTGPDHPWRKPNPGMFIASTELLGSILEDSWMIGDRLTDMTAASRAGLKGSILVTARAEMEAVDRGGTVIHQISNLRDATHILNLFQEP